MSVGTQSIRRAATKAAETGVVREEPDTVPENTAAKAGPKTAAKKKTASEKATAKKDSGVRTGVIPSVSPEVTETLRLTGREHFQINDELPVYLL